MHWISHQCLVSHIAFTDLEDEIAELEAKPELSAVEKARLNEVKKELEHINKKKEEYVEAHPEQRRLVYASARRREQQKERENAGPPVPQELKKRNLFNKNGLPRHPERSVYYDPVINPYGMPPPGLPYVERGNHYEFPVEDSVDWFCFLALLPGEVDSEAEPQSDDGVYPLSEYFEILTYTYLA